MTAIYPHGKHWLEGTMADVTSQNGEDGLIRAALDRIGERTQFCFEVGAGDGYLLSNTWTLRGQAWTCLLVEKDHALAKKCRDDHASSLIRCVEADITVPGSTLDELLAEIPADWCRGSIDLGVIDIDCQDWNVWNALQARPRLILIEFRFQPPDLPPPPLDATSSDVQAGLPAILALGESKGYVPLVRTLCNVLFVAREELWPGS